MSKENKSALELAYGSGEIFYVPMGAINFQDFQRYYGVEEDLVNVKAAEVPNTILP